ncbi:hypothetical protein [Bacteroides caecigallinarum]|nr:hypothetical protein [Bacteroides caecigallinarum]MCF2581323.1 hypothetical protein [Bacteroides caecigallinarum]
MSAIPEVPASCPAIRQIEAHKGRIAILSGVAAQADETRDACRVLRILSS